MRVIYCDGSIFYLDRSKVYRGMMVGSYVLEGSNEKCSSQVVSFQFPILIPLVHFTTLVSVPVLVLVFVPGAVVCLRGRCLS